jgi:hypothetical protein
MVTAETMYDESQDGLDAALAGEVLEDLEGLDLDAGDEGIDDAAVEALGEDALEELAGEGSIEQDALAGDELTDDALDDAFSADADAAACEGCEGLDELDDFGEQGGFGYSPASNLYVPRGSPILHGPAAMEMASRLNPFILEQLSADDADEFFKGLGRAFGGISRGIGRAVSSVARAAPGLLKAAGPLISRALPMIQQVAGKLGPWGMLVSGGLGAARALAEGKGLGGALQGALGGVTAGIPGVGSVLSKLGGAGGMLGGLAQAVGGGGGGGPLASILGAVGGKGPLGSVLGALAPSGGAGGGLAGILGGLFGGGDGADDDADLDALADLADARRVLPAIALPLGAGLAARAVARKGCPSAARTMGRRPQFWRPAQAAQRILLRAGARAGGSVGRRLRTMRAIERLAVHILRRRGGNPRQIPRTVQWAANRILQLVRAAPSVGRVAPPTAARKLALRQKVLSKVPVAALCAGAARAAA